MATLADSRAFGDAAPAAPATDPLLRPAPPLTPDSPNYGWAAHPDYYAHPNNTLDKLRFIKDSKGKEPRFTARGEHHKYRAWFITPLGKLRYPKFYPCGDFKGDWPGQDYGSLTEHEAKNLADLAIEAWHEKFCDADGFDPHLRHFMDYVQALSQRYFEAVRDDPETQALCVKKLHKALCDAARDKKLPTPKLEEARAEWLRLGANAPIKIRSDKDTQEKLPHSECVRLKGRTFIPYTVKSLAFKKSQGPVAHPSQRIANLCAPVVPPPPKPDEKDAPTVTKGLFGFQAKIVELQEMATKRIVPYHRRREVLTDGSICSLAVEVDCSFDKKGVPQVALAPLTAWLYRRGAPRSNEASALQQAHSFPGAETCFVDGADEEDDGATDEQCVAALKQVEEHQPPPLEELAPKRARPAGPEAAEPVDK